MKGYIHRFTFLPHNFLLYLHFFFLAALSRKIQFPIQFIEQQLGNLQLTGSCRMTTDHLQQLQKMGFSTKEHPFVQLNKCYHSLVTADKLMSSSATTTGINFIALLRVLQNFSAHMDRHRCEELYIAAILLRCSSLWTRC